MIFKRFEWLLLIRVVLLAGSMLLDIYFFVYDQKLVSGMIIAFLIVYQVYELYQFVLETNRKLIRFLEAVKYADFTAGFNKDSGMGGTFSELNKVFNEVFEAFRQARAEKEENWQYLKTVVQHVNVGLLSFNEITGKIELLNNTAKKLLQSNQLKNIHDLKVNNPELHNIITTLPPGGKTVNKQSNELHLSINVTALRLRGMHYKLVSIQNIQSELQQKEIEAWQNLTKVLRHEIMNSITPIASLAGTANEIFVDDVTRENGHIFFDEESYEDIGMSLQTIVNRSNGLVNFVEAYRNFTSIPQPRFEMVNVKGLIEEIVQLTKVEFKNQGSDLSVTIHPDKIMARIDKRLIEMVLINVLKNAREAVEQSKHPEVRLDVGFTAEQKVRISISDNGTGIEPEALEKIFIPFFTTKSTGSGIGLSLSQRIMQMHGGNLLVYSEAGQGTTFTLLM